MKLKRIIAALAAMCVLAAPAAFAATATPGGQSAPGTATTTTTKSTAKANAAAAARERARRKAYRTHVRLLHTLARLRGKHLRASEARAGRGLYLHWLQRSNARLRHKIQGIRRANARYSAVVRSVGYARLHAIASCESHNNPRAVGGGGAYRGLFQMTFQIWGAVGGHGDPAGAGVKEQYLRAAMVYRRYGSGQWPVCGR